MRNVTVASCLLAATWCITTLSACSERDAREDTKVAEKNADVRMTLKAEGVDGSMLKLTGVPNDSQYVGIYPNPQRWSFIEFVLGGDGIPVTRCGRDGGEIVQCSETPFFIEVRRNRVAASGGVVVRTFGVPAGGEPPPDGSGDGSGDGTSTGTSETPPPPPASEAPAGEPTPDGGGTVHVFDTHGKEVATKEVGPSAPAGTAGSTCGGGEMAGSPGRGGSSKNGEARACEAASLADTPGCDGTTVAAAAKVYCDAVNASLPAADKIDCSVLTNPAFVPSALPESRTGGDCSTYWEPARSAVTAAGYGTCEKVSLLLTQWRDRSRHELIAQGVCTSSPLILDLDGDGIHLSSLSDGVSFDLLGAGAGKKVWSAWTDGRDAFLALDRNGNGAIDGASELFGNATGDAAFADGFTALAELDDDGNGVIDAHDRAFGHLLVWRDANRDGVSAPSELMPLKEAGVRWLTVSAVRRSGPSSLDVHGNSIPLTAEFGRRDGTRGELVDAFLRYRPLR